MNFIYQIILLCFVGTCWHLGSVDAAALRVNDLETWDSLISAPSSSTQLPAQPSSIKPLFNYIEAEKELLEQIDQAQNFILFSTYHYGQSEVFLKVLEHLKQASERGVEIWMMVSSIGIAEADPNCKWLIAQFRHFKSPVSLITIGVLPWHIWKMVRNRTIHEKMFVIDNKVAFVGGRNEDTIYRSYLDSRFVLRGPVVDEISKAYAHVWNLAYPDSDVSIEETFNQSLTDLSIWLSNLYAENVKKLQGQVAGLQNGYQQLQNLNQVYDSLKEGLATYQPKSLYYRNLQVSLRFPLTRFSFFNRMQKCGGVKSISADCFYNWMGAFVGGALYIPNSLRRISVAAPETVGLANLPLEQIVTEEPVFQPERISPVIQSQNIQILHHNLQALLRENTTPISKYAEDVVIREINNLLPNACEIDVFMPFGAISPTLKESLKWRLLDPVQPLKFRMISNSLKAAFPFNPLDSNFFSTVPWKIELLEAFKYPENTVEFRALENGKTIPGLKAVHFKGVYIKTCDPQPQYYSLVGSHNLNMASSQLQGEIMLKIEGYNFYRIMHGQFMRVFEKSHVNTAQELRQFVRESPLGLALGKLLAPFL